ncbi:MAG: SEC-C metal-binding domain-containing protein [Kofleriaceae bacterium]
MPATVVDAVRSPYPCVCRCHEVLTFEQRVQGIESLYRFEDAMRGLDFLVLWDLAAPTLWRVQQQLAEQPRWVAVRDTGCLHSRLLGYCIHEFIHAYCGDVTQPNYGIPVGLPYGVPESLPLGEEAEYLRPFNEAEARAWVGLSYVGYHLFGVEWELRPARDVGTYGFAGGNAIVDVPAGYRRVAHWDSELHPKRYYALAQKIQDEARDWFTPERLDDIAAKFGEAEARGRALRTFEYPSAREMARLRPKTPGRNDLCICGSMAKWKQCCGANL